MNHPAPPTPKVAVFLGISLDGFIAGPDGDLSWLDACASESPADTGHDALMARTDTLLIGRRTYDAVLGFPEWPFAGRQVRVLTHRPLQARHGEIACAGELSAVLDELQAAGARQVYLDGGQVVQQALALGRVDELTLSWIPVVLGGGTRLFDAALPRSGWRLAHHRAFASGMVQARYEKV